VDLFATFPEQAEAKRLLRAALDDGPAHAYLLHGPAGVGKRLAALALAAALLDDAGRVERWSHPDLYVLEPLGDQIRIDDVRELRRDLHMRPFEADRRVYLVFRAHLMNAEAADALLKDLEEPPAYAVIVLVADELGPLPETIRSRCQLVPFTRLSERAIREELRVRAPELGDEEATTIARVAAGRLDRLERLLDGDAAEQRAKLLAAARGVYLDPAFDAAAAAATVLAGASRSAERARARAEEELEGLDLPRREAELRVRRAARGAEREEVLASLEELGAWYRDLVVVAAGADSTVVHEDRLAELREDATLERLEAAVRAAEIVRAAWRDYEELNVHPSLALEALFLRLRSALGAPVAA
jgi:DNA polymerase III subunit delta'